MTVVGSITILTTYLLPSPSNVRKSIDRFAGRVKQVYLEVRPSNKAGILLYHKLSFEETGKVMRKYYPDGEDAIEMERAV